MNTAPNLICNTGIFIYIDSVSPFSVTNMPLKMIFFVNQFISYWNFEGDEGSNPKPRQKGVGALSRPRKTPTGIELTCWVLTWGAERNGNKN